MTVTPLLAAALLLSRVSMAGETLVYAGTYTDGKSLSKGITLLKMNLETGALTVSGTVAELPNPSFLTLNADGTRLYAVSESSDTAAAYKVNKATGALTKLNELPVSEKPGHGPCHLCLAPDAKMLVTANYGGGSVTTFSLAEDGSLAARTALIQHTGIDKDGKEKKAHAHSALLTKDGQYVIVNDLGLDRVYIYTVDPVKHTLKPTPAGEGVAKPGAGPRHGAFDPAEKYYFSLNELDSTITPYRYDAAAPKFTAGTSVSTLPADFKGKNSTAEIVVHPGGKFVYASNRGADCIAVYGNKEGALTLTGHTPSGGKVPRNFNITPDGKWLLAAHQDTNNITVFSINQTDGTLTATPHNVTVGKPVCLVFLPQ